MAEDIKVIKEKILLGMRILAGEGVLQENKGHLSYRLDNGNIVIVGHLHGSAKTFDEVTADDLIIMDGDANVVEGHLTPIGEWPIHTEIYKARPDVRSVIHAHPRGSLVFGIAMVPIIPCYHQATIFAPHVPIMDYSAQIDTAPLGKEMVKQMGDSYAILLRAHGTANVGSTIEEAVVVAIMLESTADLQWRASVLGKPQPVRMDEMEGRHVKGQNHANYMKNAWRLYEHKYGGS